MRVVIAGASYIPIYARFESSVIDIILQSPSAQTLRSIAIYYMPDEIFTPANLLRLVRGCPLLSEFEYEDDSSEEPSPIEHGDAVDAINEMLKSRGGEEDQYRPFVVFGPSLYFRPRLSLIHRQ